MAKKRNIIVGQSGGPTSVINSSLAGVYKNAIERGFDKVYGLSLIHIFCLDDDVIVHVAPAGKEAVPELTEAFLVPKGTMVLLNTGVWHLSAIPVNKETAHVLIVLPERTYLNDCVVVDYPEEKWVEILG